MSTRKTDRIKPGLFLAIAALILIFAAAALAQDPQGSQGRFGKGKGQGRGFGPEERLEVLAEKLELTPDQVTAIEEIRDAGREKGLSLRTDMMRLRNELEGEMLKDTPSEKTVVDLVEKIGSVRTEMETNRVTGRLEMRQLLTPEQRDKMLVLREGWGNRRGRGEGRGPGRGGPCDGSGPRRCGQGAQGQ